MNKEIYERPKMHVNIGTIVYPGMSPKSKCQQELMQIKADMKEANAYSKPRSAQDLIEEARKARELNERQEA